MPAAPQRSVSTVGFSPLRERNASTASTRLSIEPGGHFAAGAGRHQRCQGRTGPRARADSWTGAKHLARGRPEQVRFPLRALWVQRRGELDPVRQDRPRVDRAGVVRRADRKAQVAVPWPPAGLPRDRARCPPRRPIRPATAAGRPTERPIAGPCRRRSRRQRAHPGCRDGRTGAPCPYRQASIRRSPRGSLRDRRPRRERPARRRPGVLTCRVSGGCCPRARRLQRARCGVGSRHSRPRASHRSTCGAFGRR